jgi:hypothetical protein
MCNRPVVVCRWLKHNATWALGFVKEIDQSIMVISTVGKSPTLQSTIRLFNQRHINALGNVNRNPGLGCDRISLASHRRYPPKGGRTTERMRLLAGASYQSLTSERNTGPK